MHASPAEKRRKLTVAWLKKLIASVPCDFQQYLVRTLLCLQIYPYIHTFETVLEVDDEGE